MKNPIQKLLVTLAMVTSFVAVQNVWAITVEGTIDSISTKPNVVVVDGIDVYGVMFKHLETKYGIVLTVNQDVSFEVYENICNDGTTLLKACEITVGNEEPVLLRPCL